MSVTLIATGGTIASTIGRDGTATSTLSGADLLASAGNLATTVDVVDLPVGGSWNLTTETAASVAATARRALLGGADGVVITHGTDVLEETAWLCELLVRDVTARGPVVLTGAMRHAAEFSPDGPRNLADAVALAACAESAGRGALVCVNGEIHHARWVTKTHATGLAAFGSPGRGPVGEVSERGVRFTAPVPPPPPLAPPDGSVVGQVPIVVSHWDVDPGIIDWHLDRGACGLVVQGGGTGNVNGGLVGRIERALDAGVPVVGTTRCLLGEVTPVYGGQGGFAVLADMGVIPSHGLSAAKARLALGVALAVDPDPDAVRRWFSTLAVHG